jgi:hypothetical protein
MLPICPCPKISIELLIPSGATVEDPGKNITIFIFHLASVKSSVTDRALCPLDGVHLQ